MWISALRKRAEARGIVVTTLARGEPQSGSITLFFRAPNGTTRMLTAVTHHDGGRAWLVSAHDLNDEMVQLRTEKLRHRDPDTWLIEIECADPNDLIDLNDLIR